MYRYKVLEGDIKVRCLEFLIQNCEAEDIQIISGVVSNELIYLHVDYLPSSSINNLMKKLKGRSSRKLQQEFLHLEKRYWSRYFWAIGFSCWSTGNLTDEMVNEYLGHHRILTIIQVMLLF